MDSTRYELVDVAGTGGMATVWRAEDRRLGRRVAVKRPNDAGDIERFEREARSAARVSHPNLVRIYDVDVDEIGPYLVMELVDGPTLAEAPPTPDETAELGAQLASALAALHAVGIVHGDVKPANVLLAEDGAKLTDFGVAHRLEDMPTGTVHATPAYAAPEVADDAAPTAASDVYSLAVVLHELVTRVPWSGAAQTQPLPGGDWSAVLGPALATDPASRPDAATIARTLAARSGARSTAVIAPTEPIGGSANPAPKPGMANAPSAGPRSDALRIADDRTSASGRWLIGTTAVVALVLIVAMVAVAVRSDDQVSSVVSSGSVPESPAPADPPPSEASVTTDPSTGPASTVPTTTAAASTTSASTPADPAEAATTALIGLIESQPPKELKPKEARDMVDRIDRAVDAVGDPERVRREIDELADRITRHLDGGTRDRAGELVLELADALGIGTSDLEARLTDD